MVKIAVDKIKNWVFVTGAPRSGTTFVGKILSLPFTTDYIHEPFNPACGMRGMTQRYHYVRPGLDTEEMRRCHAKTQQLFSYDFELRRPRRKIDSGLRKSITNVVGTRGQAYYRLARLNPLHRSAVIKDPTGCLLALYLFEHFGVKPVIVVKHPVSLAASLKRLGWFPTMAWCRDQPALLEDYFVGESEFINRDRTSFVEAAAAHWRVIYKVLLAQGREHPTWHVVLHEDLSANPVGSFRALYRSLDLPWSDRVGRRIVRLTQEGKSGEARLGRVQDFSRKSAEIFSLRLNSLTVEERRTIYDIVEDVAQSVYDRNTFALDTAVAPPIL